MSETLGPWELRAKCAETLHREFHTFAMAAGREGADVLRELASEYVDREKHAHSLRCKLLSGKGLAVDDGGKE
jgi:hypothetical protein